MSVPLEVIKFCAEEVDRQGRGPIQVWNMVDAWAFAIHAAPEWKVNPLGVIARLGALVEPTKNDGGWRHCGVRVGNYLAPRPNDVPDRMKRLTENMFDMSPAGAYHEFQLIHPFVDGNGRVGKIIFAKLNDALQAPYMPPDFFGCANP